MKKILRILYKKKLDLKKFKSIGIIKNDSIYDKSKLNYFESEIEKFKNNNWDKSDLIKLFNKMISNFSHKETGKYLDSKM